MRRWLPAIVLLLLAGCAHAPAGWDYSNLRLLDPAGDSPTPETDIIAVYTRPLAQGQEMRVDFLDFQDLPPERVYLAFDTGPGGSHEIPGTDIVTDLAWDLLVSIPTPNTTRYYLPDGSLPPLGPAPPAHYNIPQDYLTVGVPGMMLPAHFELQVFALNVDGLADSTPPASSDSPPPGRAPVVLSFQDVLPASLPATALRRWDGAHTGPYGERHGLHPLLEAARANHFPLALLDLRTPESLSALDIIGGLQEVRLLLTEGLLIVPEADYAYPAGYSLSSSVESGERFALPSSDFSYALVPEPLPGYGLQFTPLLPDPSHLARDEARDLTLIPMPPATEQVDPGGLTLETRRALIDVARSADPTDLVALGGSLPASAWGDSDVAETAMEYISQHPWILPLNSHRLESFPAVPVSYSPEIPPPPGYPRYTSTGQSAGVDSAALTSQLRGALQAAPAGPLRDTAQDMFFNLATETGDPKRDELQAQYLGEVGILLAADAWAAAPAPQATCDIDLDYDTVDECVLANDSLFAVFERDGGRLAYLFSVADGSPHQLVGGTQQFVVGLSDRTIWQAAQGPAADPHQIPGAFVDADAPWSLYEMSSLGPDSLTFTSADGTRVKSFRLFPDRVAAQYTLPSALQERFALSLDPWQRFRLGWGSHYYSRLRAERLLWSLRGGPSLTVQAPGRTSFAAFNDTLESLYGPEDPNQDFPPGHYLPFPMAVADFVIEDGQVVTLSARP